MNQWVLIDFLLCSKHMLEMSIVPGSSIGIIRLSIVMEVLGATCVYIFVYIDQNYDYELNQIFFDELSISKLDRTPQCGNAGSKTLGHPCLCCSSCSS